MRKLTSLLMLVVAAMGMFFTSSQAKAVLQADVVFIVDESGSMGTVQTNLKNNIAAFASILSAGGVDAQYALVGYGNSAIRPRLLTDLTTPAAFGTAALGLQISGGTEPAYEAIMAALNGGPTNNLGISFRGGNVVKNIIIVTDEPTNGDLAGASFANVDALLTAQSALLNGVLTNFSANSVFNGGTLAGLIGNHGGSVFDLGTFNTNNQATIDTFVQDFARRKLQEIINQQGGVVPEPISAGLSLMALAALGVSATRRRRA